MSEDNTSYQTVNVVTNVSAITKEICEDCGGEIHIYSLNTTSGYPLIKVCIRCGRRCYV